MNATQPDIAVRLLLRAATAPREERFVVYAVRTYFTRVMHASMKKLRAYGLRPVVTPVAAELALNRAVCARTFPEFVTQLVSDDHDVADLVLRAIRLYADLFSRLGVQAQKSKSSDIERDMYIAAQVIQRNLSFISPAHQPQ